MRCFVLSGAERICAGCRIRRTGGAAAFLLEGLYAETHGSVVTCALAHTAVGFVGARCAARRTAFCRSVGCQRPVAAKLVPVVRLFLFGECRVVVSLRSDLLLCHLSFADERVEPSASQILAMGWWRFAPDGALWLVSGPPAGTLWQPAVVYPSAVPIAGFRTGNTLLSYLQSFASP